MTENRPEHQHHHHRDSSPSYLRWAKSLASLLEDGEGVQLFKRYVESVGGIHAERFNFYFACEGLKQQSNPDRIKDLIGAIYRFLRKSQLAIPDDIKVAVKANLRNEKQLSANIYDQMQLDVERFINETTYPNFLISDIYLQHVQNMQAGLGGAGMSGGSAPGAASSSGYGYGGYSSSTQTSTSSSSDSGSAQDTIKRSSTLPTLHEDCELVCEEAVSLGRSQTPVEMPAKLTRDLLLATQKRRLEIRPAGARGYSVYTASAYASYNPVSLQDSERQSMSSGRTDSDTMSLGGVSFDGAPCMSRGKSSMENRIMRQASTNREIDSLAVIPRTQREHGKFPMSPEELYTVLLPKLEKIKKEQETEELFEKRFHLPQQQSKNANLADAIREKFQIDDDNDQAILDQHVSRVWSDLTPNRSPGNMSPCPTNTTRKSRNLHEIDGCSSSGIISHYSMKHSKSMPEHPGISTTSASTTKKLTKDKWPSMNTDSGISLSSNDMLMKSDLREYSTRGRGFGSDSSTAYHLEEAKRRLEDEQRRSIKKYPPHPQQQYSQQPSTSTTSTLHKSFNDFTTVVFLFCDEKLPYRIKIPGLQPTLKQFKDYLPKKGNYRYFFKTLDEDDMNSVIQEEIASDTDLLPFYEGKVTGVVKTIE